MDFCEVLEQGLVLLQRHGRISYRTLKRQFDLDDETLDGLKEELLYAHPIVDDEDRGLIWYSRRPKVMLDSITLDPH